jgi:hypothetical protein
MKVETLELSELLYCFYFFHYSNSWEQEKDGEGIGEVYDIRPVLPCLNLEKGIF